ncbi:MAG: SPOR domain-containing protein [Bacteroidales bacterium]|jgi:cell division septation protein DedD/nucleoid DNA-binding protein|nr:SPOR domain-containing protein [Bacteroidales bacterium]
MELLVHIRELLLLNDCVIIPGFGGFVSAYRPASVDVARFVAPSKSVSFNRKLKFNDGLLINHIALAHGCGYMKAAELVRQLVCEMNSRLTDGETLSVPGIGALAYDEHEALVFIPDIRENLCADAFGLPSFLCAQLPQEQATSPIPLHNETHLLMNRRHYSKFLIAASLLLLLALAPLPPSRDAVQYSALNSLTSGFQNSGLHTATPLTSDVQVLPVDAAAVVPQEAPTAEAPAVVADIAVPTVPQPEPDVAAPASGDTAPDTAPMHTQPAEPLSTPAPVSGPVSTSIPVKAPSSAPAKGCYIICGAYRDIDNARQLINELKAKGYTAKIIGKVDGKNYVALDKQFASKSAAQPLAEKYRRQTGKDTWVYTAK